MEIVIICFPLWIKAHVTFSNLRTTVEFHRREEIMSFVAKLGERIEKVS